MGARRGVAWAGVVAMGLCLSLLGTGCATYGPAQVGRGAEPEPLSLKGTGRELGRGVTNIVFCWLEIPRDVEYRVRRKASGHPFGVVSGVFHGAVGTVIGSISALQRAVGGAFEVVLSPFPPYEPLMEPAYPPYLNFGQRAKGKPEAGKEKPAGGGAGK